MATDNSTRPTSRVLDCDDIALIREALLIGLASYGEIERLQNEQNLCALTGNPVTADLAVIHPTGSADTVGLFAAALRSLPWDGGAADTEG